MFNKNNFCYRIVLSVVKGIKGSFEPRSVVLEKQPKEKIEFILIALCTCKRPKMLSVALDAVKNLNIPNNIKTEVLVIDNDEKETGRQTVEEYKDKMPLPLNYFVEPQRGIANARNRLLEEAINLGATHIAMFDDDESLDESWLLKHIELCEKYENAVISSGPTLNRFIGDYPAYITKNAVFKTSTSKLTGEKRHMCASGNVFFPVSVAKDKGIYFDNKYIYMGGEDGDFFNRAYLAGYDIIWNNEAVGYELIGDDRANLKWILNRNYYNGYSGSRVRFKNQDKVLKKFIYFINLIFSFLFDAAALLPSLLFGRVLFFIMLGYTFKNAGKIAGLVKKEPLNYYKDVCGE